MRLTPVSPGAPVSLDEIPTTPPDDLERGDELAERSDALLARMGELQEALRAENRQSLLIVLQGRDAAGKDGTIRKVFEAFNPQGCQVAAFKQPSEVELAHDYLWRIHQVVPPHGTVGIFNRSHYEDVLVVRVHGLVPEKRWRQRYAQINDFERLLTENDVTILKFFLHISKDEQRERLMARLDDPAKNWKFQPGDIDERKAWDDYTAAYEEALSRCSTPHAPWYVVPGDKKKARNFLVAEAVAETLERMNPQFPRADDKVLKKVGKIE